MMASSSIDKRALKADIENVVTGVIIKHQQSGGLLRGTRG